MTLKTNDYFDLELHQKEREQIFSREKEYIGHASMVPVAGNYYVNPDARWILTNDGQDVRVLSNICAHRQARLLNQNMSQNRNFSPPITEYLPGTMLQNITCPIHAWTYALDGDLAQTPGSSGHKACLRTEKESWNGFIFTGRGSLPTDKLPQLDSSGYYFHKRYLTGENCNWKTFIDIYCDMYHVKSAHPGLSWLIDVDSASYLTGSKWSMQTVQPNDWLKMAPTPKYDAFRQALLEYHHKYQKEPTLGAIFFLLYPNTMIEIYPGTIVVSVAYPDGPNKTVNVVDFFYTPDALFDPQFVQAQQQAYFETAREDSQLCLTTDLGRWAMYMRQESTKGVLTEQESLVKKFHEYVFGMMNPPAFNPGPR